MAKKSFNEITNPALQFMTHPQEERTEHTAADDANRQIAFKGLKRGKKPSEEETKSKRINILVFPSIHKNISKIAAMKRTSINDLIVSLMRDYVNDNMDIVNKYDEVFGKEK